MECVQNVNKNYIINEVNMVVNKSIEASVQSLKEIIKQSEEDLVLKQELNPELNPDLNFLNKYLQMNRKNRRDFCKTNKIPWKIMPKISKKINDEVQWRK